MKYGLIYKITNKINGKSYVGQTTQSISKRFSDHCYETRNNRYVSNSIRKHGKENFIVEEIAIANNQNELNELEVYYVDLHQTMYPNGYNHRSGGKQNGKCSDELKRKISQAKIGKPNYKRRGELRSEEQRIKISRGLGGKPIRMINLKTNEVSILQTAHEGEKYGFNPSNIVQICKKSNPSRRTSKGYTFEYIEDHANQSGSVESKKSSHAQRIESETGNRIKSLQESPTPIK
jgi:group I intron endonuclease